MEQNNVVKRIPPKRENIMGFICLSLLVLITTAVCCYILFSNESNVKMGARKVFAISKMERIRSFRSLQAEEVQIVDSIYKKIDNYDPGITASYEENDIKFYLNDLKGIYNKNEHDGRYKIFYQIANFYGMWLADKKEVWTKQQNIFVFSRNLDNCEIGLQRKMDELKNSHK